jgi:hypothetical protein
MNKTAVWDINPADNAMRIQRLEYKLDILINAFKEIVSEMEIEEQLQEEEGG